MTRSSFKGKKQKENLIIATLFRSQDETEKSLKSFFNFENC